MADSATTNKNYYTREVIIDCKYNNIKCKYIEWLLQKNAVWLKNGFWHLKDYNLKSR